MNPPQTDALANLRDIHLPEAVGFWPPAAGWWIALGLLLAAAWGLRLWLHARRRSVRRAALRELATIEAGFASEPDVRLLATRLSTLLRRVAVARFPRRTVAALHGEEWKRFLVKHGQGSDLTEDLISNLAAAMYAAPRPETAAGPDWSQTLGAVGGWIRGNT